MGLLPTERVKYAPPFSVVGIDYAGPLLVRRGHVRKPTLLKTYACLFICFTTRAVHIELVSDLTTDGFLSALGRFTDRRGYPSIIMSDNGTNFVGENRALKDLHKLLSNKSTQDRIHSFAASHENEIRWKFSPSRSPHFGGFWESGIKNMKVILKKLIHLTFEQLYGVLTAAESTLNSRPLMPLDAASAEGVSPLTPGHLLIGRPLRSLPSRVDERDSSQVLGDW